MYMVYGSGKPDKHVNNCAGEEQRPTEGGVQGLDTVQGETAAGGGPDELCEQSNEHYAAEGEQALSLTSVKRHLFRVGQKHLPTYGVYTAFLAGKLPNIRSCTVYIYASGQPYTVAGKGTDW
jgi:hypothetical protein